MFLGKLATVFQIVVPIHRSSSAAGARRERKAAVVDLRFSASGIALLHYSSTLEAQSLWLKLVVDGILGVVPKLERGLGGFEPGDIVRLNFQMRRQIVKEPHLVPHIQVLDCLADFLNRAHAGNFSRNFSDEKSQERTKEEGKAADAAMFDV